MGSVLNMRFVALLCLVAGATAFVNIDVKLPQVNVNLPQIDIRLPQVDVELSPGGKLLLEEWNALADVTLGNLLQTWEEKKTDFFGMMGALEAQIVNAFNRVDEIVDGMELNLVQAVKLAVELKLKLKNEFRNRVETELPKVYSQLRKYFDLKIKLN